MSEYDRDIRKEREKLKVTQADMAIMVGVSRLTYIGYEKDPGGISVRTYHKICQILDRLDKLARLGNVTDANPLQEEGK